MSITLHIETKICHQCNQTKLVDEFGKRSRNKDGLHEKCKACCADYYSKNKPKINDNSRKRYNLNKESINNYQRSYYDKNKKRINARHRKYYAENLTKQSERSRAYYLANKTKAKNKYNARRARLLNNGIYLITEKELNNLYNSNCFYCGSNQSIQVDHVVPISKGGAHSIGNLVPACAKCNLSKHNKLLIEWKFCKNEH